MPDTIKAQDLINGECPEVPTLLKHFYVTALSSSNYKRKRGRICQRLAKSFSEDFIYAVSNGEIKPSKHISLGLAVKGLTNSMKVVKILHRYGHVLSYDRLEELETESALAIVKNSEVCPEDILRDSRLRTGLAWNNFDRFVDTTSGKDTLHDTVGIIFQDIPNSDSSDESESDDFHQDDENIADSENSTLEVFSTHGMVHESELVVQTLEMSVENHDIQPTEPLKKRMKRSFDAVLADIPEKPKRKLTS